MKNKNNKKQKLISIGSIALVFSFGSLSYSSYILYISSRSIYINNKSIEVHDFIRSNIDKWNSLCLLVANNTNAIDKNTTLIISNSNNSYIYICYKYANDNFKYNWNEYINKYKNNDLIKINNQLIYDLRNNKLFENSNLKLFSNNLSYLMDDLLFYRVNDLYAFIFSLIFVLIGIMVTIFIVYWCIKNRKNIRHDILSKE